MSDLPRPPAHVQRFVDVLGVDGTIDFLNRFGGAEVFLSPDPKGNSQIAREIGLENARRLSKAAHTLPRRIPNAKRWIMAVWYKQGLPIAEIARRLRVTDVTIRRWLKAESFASEAIDNRQLPLF